MITVRTSTNGTITGFAYKHDIVDQETFDVELQQMYAYRRRCFQKLK